MIRYLTSWPAWLAAIIVLALAACGLQAFWLEPSSLQSREYPVVLHGVEARPLSGLRIAVIADLHAGAWYIDDAKVREVVAITNAARPDLILLAGDYIVNKRRRLGGHNVPIEQVAPLLKVLSAPLGVYAVIGNHDRWERAKRVTRALSSVGIPVLENRSIPIRFGTQTFYLIGIGDKFTNASNPKRALQGISKIGLCLTHSPDVFPELPKTCVLTIAGHTHGGQVSLPVVGRLIVPSQFGQRYAAGQVVENGRTLFVSTGIGTSIIPVRFGVPPEVTLLKIVVAPQSRR